MPPALRNTLKRTRPLWLALSLSLSLAVSLLAVDCGQAKAADVSALSLWTPAELAEPRDPFRAKAERQIRPLPRPDLPPPAGAEAEQPAPPPLPESWRGIVRRVRLPKGDRRVALTFDLCERAVHVTGYDAALVDALRSFNNGQGARATFFAGGKWLRSHPERALQLLADPRFELGHHGWTHANMRTAPPQERARQVRWTEAQFAALRAELSRRLAAQGLPAAAPPLLRLFRLPYGRGGADTAAWLNARGLAVIQWDVVGEGFGGDAAERARSIAAASRPGSIILLHANCVPKDTAQVVRLLLPQLAARGLSPATVGELLSAGEPETAPEGYFSIPGDNAAYDTLYGGHGTLGRSAGQGARRRR